MYGMDLHALASYFYAANYNFLCVDKKKSKRFYKTFLPAFLEPMNAQRHHSRKVKFTTSEDHSKF